MKTPYEILKERNEYARAYGATMVQLPLEISEILQELAELALAEVAIKASMRA